MFSSILELEAKWKGEAGIVGYGTFLLYSIMVGENR